MVFLILAPFIVGQVSYDGPAQGSVNSGVILSTSGNNALSPHQSGKLRLFNHFKPEEVIDPQPSSIPNVSQKVFNLNRFEKTTSTSDSVIVFKNFRGIGETNSIPPDPYIAVGSDHIMTVVNSSFRISDKEGNTLESISADAWYNDIISNVSAFDPKITYDQFDNRWIMVWLHVDDANSTAYYLVSVSDDENPIGDWYNWKIPSNTNGDSPIGNWGDYQGVGYDHEAIYFTSNQFGFSGGFDYPKLRIFDKDELYAGPGKVNWTDIWDISYPSSSVNAFGIRPARMKDTTDAFYLAVHSPFITKTDFGVYKLTSPLTNPVLDGDRVPVTQYYTPDDPEQLGGGDPRIDGGGANLRNEPLYRDGKLYMVHSVRTSNTSAARMIVVDEEYNLLEDVKVGSANHYHTYPAIAVNKTGDILITYSRSSAEEYMGAYFTVIPSSTSQPAGDLVLEEGNANYVKTYGGSRNRWGDYNGAWVDPVNDENFWVSTEFVALEDTWGVKIGGIRARPFDEPTGRISAKEFEFGLEEINKTADTVSFTLTNLGMQNLEIDQLTLDNDNFSVVDAPDLPYSIAALDTLELSIEFSPVEEGLLEDSLTISTNDPDNPDKTFYVTGEGFQVYSPDVNQLYGVTGRGFGSKGLLIAVDTASGEGTEIGYTGFEPLLSLTWNKNENELLALSTAQSQPSTFIRISATDAKGYEQFDAPIDIDAMTFDKDNQLIGITKDHKLYEMEYKTGDTTYVADVPVDVLSIAFHPTTNELYASVEIEAEKDLIYKLDKNTGDTTRVGRTGFNEAVSVLAFNNKGELYGSVGAEFSISKLLKINRYNGEGEVIGETGMRGILGLAFVYDSLAVSVEREEGSIPKEFALEQNYPNPFNPTTTINFALPEKSNVKLTVYDILGKEIKVLVNEEKAAGRYEVDFNAGNFTSGVYIYKLETDQFSKAMKMQLVK